MILDNTLINKLHLINKEMLDKQFNKIIINNNISYQHNNTKYQRRSNH